MNTESGGQPDLLAEFAERTYCQYIEQMRKDECLGADKKIELGKFGRTELDAHCRGAYFLGMHRAYSKARQVAKHAPLPINVQMLEALEFVEEFFAKLERDTDEDDPLRKIRECYHAPIHDRLRPLIQEARAELREHQPLIAELGSELEAWSNNEHKSKK
jgi:hypothetical protein